MTDLTQMIRWNANFVRGLAESVLNRAKVIRTSLTPRNPEVMVKAPRKAKPKKAVAAKRPKKSSRRTKRTDA